MKIVPCYMKFSPSAVITLASLYFIPLQAGAFDAETSFERGRRDLPKVALTFDGGSDEGDSGLILSILEKKSVRTTFFLTGEYIMKYPHQVLEMTRAGHEVGNHTWSHPHLTAWERNRRHATLPGIDRDFLHWELQRTARVFSEVTGLEMAPLWRAPFGEINSELARWAAGVGYRHIAWTRDDRGVRSLDSLDWVADRNSRLYLDSARIRDRILAFGQSADGLHGGIVLMHLSTRKRDPGVTRLAELIDSIRQLGYRIVPVSELLHDRGLTPPPMLSTFAVATQ